MLALTPENTNNATCFMLSFPSRKDNCRKNCQNRDTIKGRTQSTSAILLVVKLIFCISFVVFYNACQETNDKTWSELDCNPVEVYLFASVQAPSLVITTDEG